MELNKEIARHLLAIKAVQIRPDDYFTWTSGIKSPIYCDNRLTMSYPEVRKAIVKGFMKKIEQFEKKPDVIAGCATAGIPHAAWLAEALDLPMVYVRSKPKGHGKGNQIEGTFDKGQNVLVIEDLISTGGSALEAATVLQEEGANVLGVLAIFTYGLKVATNNFEEKGFPFDTLTGFDTLLEVLVEDAQITQEERAQVLSWREKL
ncbi:MAG TPA: orotate phosphoribosyltransferase [Pseudogracilibacillus sp.]|nr:orotate phosphoribosyltransferase [Pseudogracilibacillus sp.]